MDQVRLVQRHHVIVLVICMLMLGCASQSGNSVSSVWEALIAHCGQQFSGRVMINEPLAPDDPFHGQSLQLKIARCDADRIEMPLAVGSDHSRTWILLRDATGIELKHEHRHADGTLDALSNYGGLDQVPVGAELQFPADEFSRKLFEREGRAAAVDNVWSLRWLSTDRLQYELSRPGRRAVFEFDLAQPLP